MNNDYERYGFWFLENQEQKKENTLQEEVESNEETINNPEEEEVKY